MNRVYRLLRWMGWLLAALLVLLSLAVLSPWSGAIVLGPVLRWVPGIELQQASGSLWSGYELRGLAFSNAAVELRVDHLRAMPRPGSWMDSHWQLSRVDARGVDLRITPSNGNGAAANRAMLPALRVDALEVHALRVRVGIGLDEHVDSLNARLVMAGQQIDIDALQFVGARGRIDGHAVLSGPSFWPSEGVFALRTQLQGQGVAVSADITDASPRGEARIEISGPDALSLLVDYPLSDPMTDLRIRVLRALAPLPGAPEAAREVPVGWDLQMRWADAALDVQGDVRIDQQVFTLELQSEVPPLGAPVQFTATLRDAQGGTMHMKSSVGWNGRWTSEHAFSQFRVEWPARDRLRLEGRLAASGDATGWRLAPDLELLSDQYGQGQVRGVLGSNAQIPLSIEAFQLDAFGATATLDGALGASGRLQLDARVTDFDPGWVRHGLRGRLDADFALSAQGSWENPQLDLQLRALDGQFMDRPVSGGGKLVLAESKVDQANLDLALGDARLRVNQVSANLVRVDLALPDLGILDPRVGGDLTLQADLDPGSRSGRLTLRSEALHTQDLRLQGLMLGGSVGGSNAPELDFDLDLELAALQLRDRRIAGITMQALGSLASHRLAIEVDDPDLQSRMRLAGGWIDGQWAGALTDWTTRIRLPAVTSEENGIAGPVQHAALRLESPAALRLARDHLQVGMACLALDSGRLCAEAEVSDARFELDLRAQALNPGQVLSALYPDATVQARVDGEAQVVWLPGRNPEVEVSMRAEELNLAFGPAQSRQFQARGVVLDANADASGVHATLQAQTRPEGRIDARLHIDPSGALVGSAGLDLADLSIIESFNTELAGLNGEAALRIGIGGTLEAPKFDGGATLSASSAELPRLGLHLSEIEASVRPGGDGRFQLMARAHSGEGTLEMEGQLDPADPDSAVLRLAARAARVLDLPGLRVDSDQDLVLRREKDQILIEGRVAIPSARIDLARIRGNSRVSSDVQVLGADTPEQTPGLRWRADLEVTLGDQVSVRGHGLDARAQGSLRVRQRSDRVATASGELSVAGRFEAYGQKLKISEGRLLYSGGAIDNPLLSLRAGRKIKAQSVGVTVSGTARRPTLGIYSDPPINESDALALLVTGRSLRQTGSEDSGALSAAAAALGTVSGDLLARSLGGRLGLDEIAVGEADGIDGTAFTFGKYLSPRLFVGYGVGLAAQGQAWTVRFSLNERWELEAMSGEAYRAFLNYRVER